VRAVLYGALAVAAWHDPAACPLYAALGLTYALESIEE
jgi:hypothetical protein